MVLAGEIYGVHLGLEVAVDRWDNGSPWTTLTP